MGIIVFLNVIWPKLNSIKEFLIGYKKEVCLKKRWTFMAIKVAAVILLNNINVVFIVSQVKVRSHSENVNIRL